MIPPSSSFVAFVITEKNVHDNKLILVDRFALEHCQRTLLNFDRAQLFGHKIFISRNVMETISCF